MLLNNEFTVDEVSLGNGKCYERIYCDKIVYTQRRVQPDQCCFTVQITGINFECSL